MRAIIKEPRKDLREIEIDNTLEALQEAVGGYLETYTVRPDLTILIDEEGKIKGKDLNFWIPGDYVSGTALFVGVAGDDFTDIGYTIEDIADVLEELDS